MTQEVEKPETEVLKQDRIGRVRTPAARREALLAEFDRSGMSGAEFASFIGVKYQTFATWIQKRKRSHQAGGTVVRLAEGCGGQAAQMKWVEASIEQAATPGPEENPALIVELGSGTRMAVSDSRQAALAAELLRHWEGGRRC